MRILIVILSLFVLPFIAFSQKEQPEAIAETMSSTFNLYGDRLTGTCFMLVKDGKQYFVTAAHLFKSSHKSGDVVPIQMVIQNQLQSFNATVYFHENRKVDIAVFTLSEKIMQNIELPEEYLKHKKKYQELFPGNGISTDSISTLAGIDVFFFGFPLGNLGTEFLGIKFPLVKKAIISGWVNHNGITMLLLDGYNNVGFSGGPVVAYDTAGKKMCVVGAVSGYIPEEIQVKRRKEMLSVNANSGIIICYEKDYIEDIFTSNKKRMP
jgi:hypothetical protein